MTIQDTVRRPHITYWRQRQWRGWSRPPSTPSQRPPGSGSRQAGGFSAWRAWRSLQVRAHSCMEGARETGTAWQPSSPSQQQRFFLSNIGHSSFNFFARLRSLCKTFWIVHNNTPWARLSFLIIIACLSQQQQQGGLWTPFRIPFSAVRRRFAGLDFLNKLINLCSPQSLVPIQTFYSVLYFLASFVWLWWSQ